MRTVLWPDGPRRVPDKTIQGWAHDMLGDKALAEAPEGIGDDILGEALDAIEWPTVDEAVRILGESGAVTFGKE